MNLLRLELRAASESSQAVQIVWVGLNSNLVWLMKSSASEPGLKDHVIERFGLGDAFGDFYLSGAW